jgi:hypothetical protein
MLPAQLSGFRTGFRLAQHRDDLLFREPASLHQSVPHRAGLKLPVEENLSGRSPRVAASEASVSEALRTSDHRAK